MVKIVCKECGKDITGLKAIGSWWESWSLKVLLVTDKHKIIKKWLQVVEVRCPNG